MKDTQAIRSLPHPWLRRLSDYHSGGVSGAERAAVEAHLATCAQCQQALSAYHRFYTLARSPLQLDAGGAEAGIPDRPFTEIPEEEIMSTATDREHEPTRTLYRKPPTGLKMLGAIAAVLVLTILAASLFAYFGSHTSGPAAKLTPTPDAQARAYLTELRTYWRPLNADLASETLCFRPNPPSTPTPSVQLSDMLSCRPYEARVVSDARALLAHLTEPPPARWQTADRQLKQAVQATLTAYTELVAAVDARDYERWNGLFLNQRSAALLRFCDPIDQIDAGLPYNQQMPLTAEFVCGPG
jgi:hypothetical protein